MIRLIFFCIFEDVICHNFEQYDDFAQKFGIILLFEKELIEK